MDAVPIVYDIRNNEWTTQFKLNTRPGATEPSTHSLASTVPDVADSTINIPAIGGGIAGVVVTVALIGILFYRSRVTSRERTGDESNKDTVVNPSVREPQDPGGNLDAELRSRYPSSPPSSYSRPMYYDQDELFKLMVASPLTGPHAFMKDPQGQQHRPTSSDEDELKGNVPSGGLKEFNHQQSSSSTTLRSPQLVDRAPTTLQDWSSNGNSDDSDDDGDKSKETAQPNPPSPQAVIADGQGGPSRAPQWQPLIPIAFPDQKQNVDGSQEIVRMMSAIWAEQIELEKRMLVQGALPAQMRAAYPDSQPTLRSNKK